MQAMPRPPYLEIAAQLRRQIDDGALAPGARIPSTRELARTWQVAPATAAHALRSLVTAGAITARPRAGYVVAAKRPPAAHAREPLRAEILRAAIAIADDEGLPALSIRGVAAKLGVAPMSLYRHVASKYELVRAMADLALGDLAVDSAAIAAMTWRERVATCARGEWEMFKRHPWAARVVHVSRPSAHPNSLALADRMLDALALLGVTAADALRLHIAFHVFIQGLALNLEAEAEAASETGMSDEEWIASQAPGFAAEIRSGRIPAFARVFDALGAFELDYDEIFEQWLRAFLDGLAARYERRYSVSASRAYTRGRSRVRPG